MGGGGPPPRKCEKYALKRPETVNLIKKTGRSPCGLVRVLRAHMQSITFRKMIDYVMDIQNLCTPHFFAGPREV